MKFRLKSNFKRHNCKTWVTHQQLPFIGILKNLRKLLLTLILNQIWNMLYVFYNKLVIIIISDLWKLIKKTTIIFRLQYIHALIVFYSPNLDLNVKTKQMNETIWSFNTTLLYDSVWIKVTVELGRILMVNRVYHIRIYT
jgi:hypothetical protein